MSVRRAAAVDAQPRAGKGRLDAVLRAGLQQRQLTKPVAMDYGGHDIPREFDPAEPPSDEEDSDDEESYSDNDSPLHGDSSMPMRYMNQWDVAFRDEDARLRERDRLRRGDDSPLKENWDGMMSDTNPWDDEEGRLDHDPDFDGSLLESKEEQDLRRRQKEEYDEWIAWINTPPDQRTARPKERYYPTPKAKAAADALTQAADMRDVIFGALLKDDEQNSVCREVQQWCTLTFKECTETHWKMACTALGIFVSSSEMQADPNVCKTLFAYWCTKLKALHDGVVYDQNSGGTARPLYRKDYRDALWEALLDFRTVAPKQRPAGAPTGKGGHVGLAEFIWTTYHDKVKNPWNVDDDPPDALYFGKSKGTALMRKMFALNLHTTWVSLWMKKLMPLNQDRSTMYPRTEHIFKTIVKLEKSHPIMFKDAFAYEIDMPGGSGGNPPDFTLDSLMEFLCRDLAQGPLLQRRRKWLRWALEAGYPANDLFVMNENDEDLDAPINDDEPPAAHWEFDRAWQNMKDIVIEFGGSRRVAHPPMLIPN